MMTLQELATFFGWCSVVNLAFYLFTVTAVWLLSGVYASIVTRIFEVSQETSRDMVLEYIGRYKLAIIMFNLTPYVALRIMLAA